MATIGISSHKELLKLDSIQSSIDGNTYKYKKINLDQVLKLVNAPGFSGEIIGYDIAIQPLQDHEILLPVECMFYCCRFSSFDPHYKIISINFDPSTIGELFFRDCVFDVDILVSSSKKSDLKFEVISTSEEFRCCIVGRFKNVYFSSSSKVPIDFDARFECESFTMKSIDSNLMLSDCEIEDFVVKNSIINNIVSIGENNIERFECDSKTLFDSTKIQHYRPLAPKLRQKKLIENGWRLLEDATPESKKRHIEYIAYLNGLNKVRATDWFSKNIVEKFLLMVRYKLLRNFSSIGRMIFLNVSLILVFSLIYYGFQFIGLGEFQKLEQCSDYVYYSAVIYSASSISIDIEVTSFLKVVSIFESFVGLVMIIFTGFSFQKWVMGDSLEFDE